MPEPQAPPSMSDLAQWQEKMENAFHNYFTRSFSGARGDGANEVTSIRQIFRAMPPVFSAPPDDDPPAEPQDGELLAALRVIQRRLSETGNMNIIQVTHEVQFCDDHARLAIQRAEAQR